MRKPFLYLTAFTLILLFLWTRFYKIETSLLFFNDIGRDFLALWQWRQTGRPPLLGPQTSALPFNQSAIYFYMLYPFYLLSGHSPYASLLAYSAFYVLSFILGLYLLRQFPRLQRSLLLVFALLTIHPQYIIQGRFIWNPSFVTPCLLVAIYSLLIYLQEAKPDSKKLLISALALGLAISFSYSVAPLLIAVLGLLLYRARQSLGRFMIYLMGSLALWNLPTAVFELRHGFLLSKMMLFGSSPDQGGNFFWTRVTRLIDFAFVVPAWGFYLFLLVLFGAYYLLWRQSSSGLRTDRQQFANHSLFLFTATLLATVLAPVSMHSHYIFGVLTVFFVLISFLPRQLFYFALVFIIGISLLGAWQSKYFATARHSVAELQACAVHFCASYRQPLFISNQSSHHPYHNAMEFQYFMSEAGCQVHDINTQTEQAQNMAVVLDGDTYEHGKTSFNELSLFGKAQEKERFICEKDLEVVMLEKYQL